MKHAYLFDIQQGHGLILTASIHFAQFIMTLHFSYRNAATRKNAAPDFRLVTLRITGIAHTGSGMYCPPKDLTNAALYVERTAEYLFDEVLRMRQSRKEQQPLINYPL